MALAKRYNPQTQEPMLQAWWAETGAYAFNPAGTQPIFSIDTPPPTVSGHLHLGHVYSYSQTDFIARYRRMQGDNVFYPMGYDDNGLPTERLVEKQEGVRASDIGRAAFAARCLAVGAKAEKAYETLWQRLGLSIDWRYSYRTIGPLAQRTAQWSFLDLHRRGLAYRQQAPAIWCPECQTAIAQAEVDDLLRGSTFYTLAFTLPDGELLPIATTRPELLPACVAIFIHPQDPRAARLVGQQATVPLFGQSVPILADRAADPQKGTGIVMCCTFGDTADVAWWYSHKLPLVEAIGRDGRMLPPAGAYANLPLATARQQIVAQLAQQNLLLNQQPIEQTVRIHERCDTPVEYIVTPQWFIRVLDFKPQLLAAGEQITWHPAPMKARYRQWVENLGWDWCISRQRHFGVPFPVWYCTACGETIPASTADLPLDPATTRPGHPCPACGGTHFTPEQDVMDTWATSSLTPQIAGQWLSNQSLYESLTPFALRSQAHEIIRTWAFYTIVKSHHHFGHIPWQQVTISGWALAPEGSGKISKSRGGGPATPQAMIDRYSADAVRYWAASSGLGKDAIIDEQKIQAGQRLVTKLWHVARFASRFLTPDMPPAGSPAPTLTLADRWILARTQQAIERTTTLLEQHEYATARSELEAFFWHDLADNYLEMAKKRLYDGPPAGAGAIFALRHALLATLQLFAPILPYITEAIYQGLFIPAGASPTSIHRRRWPQATTIPLTHEMRAEAIPAGETLVSIATTVRRYKSEANLSLGAELAHLHLATPDDDLANTLQQATADIISITRARQVTVASHLAEGLVPLPTDSDLHIAIQPA